MRSGCGLSSTEFGGVAGKKVDQPLILRAFVHGWNNKQEFTWTTHHLELGKIVHILQE